MHSINNHIYQHLFLTKIKHLNKCHTNKLFMFKSESRESCDQSNGHLTIPEWNYLCECKCGYREKLSLFQYLKSPFGAQTAQGHIPHLSPWEMIQRKINSQAVMETRITSQWNRKLQPETEISQNSHNCVFRGATRPENGQRTTFSEVFLCGFNHTADALEEGEREGDLWREKSLSLHPRLFSGAGWKAILLVDWRMMLLLRAALHQAEGASEGFLPGVQLCWWVSCQMPHCPNYPASMVSPPGTNLQRHATIPLWRRAPGRPYGGETFPHECRDSERQQRRWFPQFTTVSIHTNTLLW